MQTEIPLDAETLQHRLDGLMKLVDITRELAAKHSLNDVLQSITEKAVEALNCERASLFLYDEEKEELFTRVATKLEIEEIRSSIETGITGWVVRRKRVANIPDPQEDARWNSAIDKQTGFTTRNILASPLIATHDDRLVGVLQLLNKHGTHFDEFDEKLVTAFASHAATAIERAELLERAERSQKLQFAVELGHRIQSGFLPEKLPKIEGYQLAAWWEPAEDVSGDYYDLIKLPDCRLGLAVADVSGHGIGPSLIMASVRAMLRVIVRNYSNPDDILERLSQSIDPDLKEGRFITFLMAAVNPTTHELTFCNAGHGPAFVYHKAGNEFDELKATTLPLGIRHEEGFPAGEPITLEKGDVVLLATDGTIELRNEEGEFFGKERLKKLVADHCHQTAEEIVQTLKTTIGEFRTDPPPDDVTFVVLKREG